MSLKIGLEAFDDDVVVEDDIVIVDLYGNPIKITPTELQYLAFGRWQEQMNAWLIEHDQLAKNR